MGNMAKSIFEDLGAKNPEMPGTWFAIFRMSALTTPLPCPAGSTDRSGKTGEWKNSVQARNHPDVHGPCRWPMLKATASSSGIPGSLVFEYSGVAHRAWI